MNSTVNSPDTLLYDVVDALQIPIYDVNNRWRGHEIRQIVVGLWKFEANVTVVGHMDRADLSTFFVKVVGGLWLYVVSQKDQPLLVMALDGPVLKLTVDTITGFGPKTLRETMEKLAPGITAAFEFNADTNKWEEVSDANTSHLDKQQSAKDPVAALPAPSGLSND